MDVCTVCRCLQENRSESHSAYVAALQRPTTAPQVFAVQSAGEMRAAAPELCILGSGISRCDKFSFLQTACFLSSPWEAPLPPLNFLVIWSYPMRDKCTPPFAPNSSNLLRLEAPRGLTTSSPPHDVHKLHFSNTTLRTILYCVANPRMRYEVRLPRCHALR